MADTSAKTNTEINIIKIAKNERWVIYSKEIEATKITSDWYLWMHHTTDVVPNFTEKNKYSWQKKHSENKTGTSESFKPTKIKKNIIKKNMKLGFKIYIYLIYFYFLIFQF